MQGTDIYIKDILKGTTCTTRCGEHLLSYTPHSMYMGTSILAREPYGLLQVHSPNGVTARMVALQHGIDSLFNRHPEREDLVAVAQNLIRTSESLPRLGVCTASLAVDLEFAR